MINGPFGPYIGQMNNFNTDVEEFQIFVISDRPFIAFALVGLFIYFSANQ